MFRSCGRDARFCDLYMAVEVEVLDRYEGAVVEGLLFDTDVEVVRL